MSAEPLRFIHAADMHLERPLTGLGPVQEPLRSKLIDAPFEAARRVFETACLEKVDFVVLSGDIIQPVEAGPASIVFLAEQLATLAEAGISVFWAGGRRDRFHQWPKAAVLPDTVYRTGARDVRCHPFYRQGEVTALVQVAGYQGRTALDPEAYRVESPSVPLIAVGYGELKENPEPENPVTYWALGGRHQPHTEDLEHTVIHYAGSPQGRERSETGAHGCALVVISADGNVEVEQVACDAVQWVRREIRMTKTMSRRKLERQLVELTRDVLAQGHKDPQLIQWSVTGADRVSWSSPSVAAEILQMLRRRFESNQADLWVSDMEFQYAEEFPVPVLEPETLAADFFEVVQQLRGDPEWLQVLSKRLEDFPQVAESVNELLANSPVEQGLVLKQVAYLGIDLLGAHQSRTDELAHDAQSLREAS